MLRTGWCFAAKNSFGNRGLAFLWRPNCRFRLHGGAACGSGLHYFGEIIQNQYRTAVTFRLFQKTGAVKIKLGGIAGHSLIQGNPRLLYGLLFQAAADTLLGFGWDPRWIGGEIGATLVLHSRGQNLR